MESIMITPATSDFRRTCAALGMGAFVAFANIYTTQPLLPLLSQEFGTSALFSGLSVSLVIFSLGISLLLYAPLSDALGRRWIMRLSLAVTVILTFALALAPGFGSLLLIRMLQGFFIGGLPALALAYVGEEFSPEAYSSAMAIYIAATSLSGISGRLISGLAADLGGWRLSFLVMGLVSLIFVILFFQYLPPSRHFQPRRLCLNSLCESFSCHLRNPVLLPAFLVGGINFFIFVGLFNNVAYLLVAPPFQLAPGMIALLFLTFLAGTVSSALSNRITRGRLRSTGIAWGFLAILGGLGLTLVPHLAVVVGGLLLVSFGFFLVHSLASAWVGREVRCFRAGASALYLIFYYLGGSLGSLYFAFFWDRFGWSGVVFAALPVMLMAAVCVHRMGWIERQPPVANEASGLQPEMSILTGKTPLKTA
jgi:MFS transporter, YNFM family, putative membrane transport protein